MHTVDRFQLLESHELQSPHNCATCGAFTSNRDRKFIYFGLDLDYYGSVYICTICMRGASIIAPASEKHALLQEMEEAEVKYINLINEIQDAYAVTFGRLKDLNDTITGLRSRIDAISDHEPSSDVDGGSQDDGDNQYTDGSDSDPSKGEDRSAEQADVQRLTNILKHDSDFLGFNL